MSVDWSEVEDRAYEEELAERAAWTPQDIEALTALVKLATVYSPPEAALEAAAKILIRSGKYVEVVPGVWMFREGEKE